MKNLVLAFIGLISMSAFAESIITIKTPMVIHHVSGLGTGNFFIHNKSDPDALCSALGYPKGAVPKSKKFGGWNTDHKTNVPVRIFKNGQAEAYGCLSTFCRYVTSVQCYE